MSDPTAMQNERDSYRVIIAFRQNEDPDNVQFEVERLDLPKAVKYHSENDLGTLCVTAPTLGDAHLARVKLSNASFVSQIGQIEELRNGAYYPIDAEMRKALSPYRL